MHTKVHQVFATSSASKQATEAKDIIAKCVHCGFCTATCPTYQVLKDERDGPRGRIYLIKQFLETGSITEKSRVHLDRCLTCRSCETTCPSGVEYGRLIEVAREMTQQTLPRDKGSQALRWLLGRVLPNPWIFSKLLFMGRTVKPMLPAVLKNKIPKQRIAATWPQQSHQRVMLAFDGCVQSVTSPTTNVAMARVLEKLSISVVQVPKLGCCGAVNHHLSELEQALTIMRNNIDAWWPAIEAGAEAIVMTASGCGAMVQDYAHLLADDLEYAGKAKKVSELCKDISQVMLEEDLSSLVVDDSSASKTQKVAVHCPCTLQHAMGQAGAVEQILVKMGVNLAKTKDSHICCGSAGTYSILQPKLSKQLLSNKINSLSIESPQRIVTSNIGCQMHLESKAKVPVDHWIELVDELV
jgi:glycolate oxidase iron-sulfur subunit